MIWCPYCGYKDSEILEAEGRIIEGEKGQFFRLSNEVKMVVREFGDIKERDLIGCPNCEKVFMD